MQEITPTSLAVFMTDEDGNAYASKMLDGDKVRLAATLLTEFVEWIPIEPLEITIRRRSVPKSITIQQEVSDQENK